jgi:amino acid adenylation domain-containing protein
MEYPSRHVEPPKMLPQQGPAHNLSIINPHPCLLRGPVLLHDLVASSSTATAIDFLEDGSKRRTFSYKTLHTLSDALAQKITRSLEKLENASSIIPVLLPQCPELYIVLLAILKAGKAFCPLSLDTPAERLSFILDDVSADLIITNSVHDEKFHIPSHIATLHVDQESFREGEHSLNTPPHTHTNNLAYVLYTSGSTGLPKAVCVSHRAATQSLLAHDRHIPRFTRFLQFAAPTFDVSVFEIFFPWYRGCTLSGRTRARMLDNLPETIRLLDIDAAELTPTVVSNLLEGRSSVPSLGLLLTIGEMLTRDVIEQYGGSDTNEGILWAMYGPTEAAIHCTLYPQLPASASTQMIGSPLDTVSAFVVAPLSQEELSPAFSILPTGEEGELVVGGPQVAEGYLNRSELTATSFIHHPQYGYLYRTGDRAKLRTDGTLQCLGRVVTGQVKLRGQRVELGEIEQTILKVEGCRATTVKVIDEDLIAFCATGSNEVSRTDVLQVCKQWLPDIMVPSDVIIMHRMPQLGSGKIDQSSLVEMYRQTVYREGSQYTTSDKIASNTVLGLLQHHLKTDLKLQSNLASVGLDSLQAIRLASTLRANGYQITTLQILYATTVEDILRITQDAKEANGDHYGRDLVFTDHSRRDIPELRAWHAEIACILPCTPLQEAMLAETTARPNAYCNWIELELQEQQSFEKIKSALQHLAQCNEILRSGFYPAAIEKSTFVQIIWRELDDSQVWQVSDFSRHFILGSHESFLRPLAVQVKLCPGKPRLLFQIHHSLYDGWSLDLIIQDLEDLLCGNDTMKRPQYSEVVRYYNERGTASQRLDEEYWAALLRDRPVTPLPNFNGQIVENTASHSVAGRSTVNLQSLIERSRQLQVSPQVWFQAAVTFISSLYTGSSDMVIGNVSSGRTIPVAGVEDIVGPCIASLPFRLRFDRSTKVEDILRETQRLNLKSLEHCALPLREIAKVANVKGEARLFDVLFVWQQSLGLVSDVASFAYVVDSADELEFAISFEFEPRSDHISFRTMFDPSVIPENQINYLSRQVDEIVNFFLEDVNRTMSDVAACFPTDLCSIANPVPRQSLLQHGPAHAVEKWAAARPDQVALSFFHRTDGVMEVKATATYATLNSRANQLARVLLSRGVHQGCLVAVVMDKSFELYVTILAVSKVGAGYLPLVPDLPEERIKTIMNDAKITVCISDSSGPSHLQQSATLVVLDIDKIDLARYGDDNISVSYNGAHVAYAVYTSGSTGTPKGVLVTQENLMSNLDYLSTVYPYSASSKLLQSCSQAFDVSVFEIFFSWHVGICLCSAKKDDLFFDLEGAINQMGVTHLSLTPTVAALIDPDNVQQVEFLVTAGEAVTEHVRRRWTGRGLYQGENHRSILQI